MSYAVKEIYATLQGEGANAGRAAVFCRFAGCNLWTGREADRQAAVCTFCDTDFVGTDGPGGGRFDSAAALADSIVEKWTGDERPFVVFTGGEPLLQLDAPLIDALHEARCEIAVETNGTLPAPSGIDWLCVSPKSKGDVVVRHGDELKLVYPQAGTEPEQFAGWDFGRFYLQPMDGPRLEENTALAVQYCLAHPQWRLSVQTHKTIGIP